MNMTRAAEASIHAVSPLSILGTGTSSFGVVATGPESCRRPRFPDRFAVVSGELQVRFRRANQHFRGKSATDGRQRYPVYEAGT